VITLSMKNMILGAPLHQAPKETTRWNDKRRYHVGIRQSMYNMFLTAQRLQPNWGATIIDGFEGWKATGPVPGPRSPSRLGHRLDGLRRGRPRGGGVHGRDASWLGWLKYSGRGRARPGGPCED